MLNKNLFKYNGFININILFVQKCIFFKKGFLFENKLKFSNNNFNNFNNFNNINNNNIRLRMETFAIKARLVNKGWYDRLCKFLRKIAKYYISYMYLKLGRKEIINQAREHMDKSYIRFYFKKPRSNRGMWGFINSFGCSKEFNTMAYVFIKVLKLLFKKFYSVYLHKRKRSIYLKVHSKCTKNFRYDKHVKVSISDEGKFKLFLINLIFFALKAAVKATRKNSFNCFVYLKKQIDEALKTGKLKHVSTLSESDDKYIWWYMGDILMGPLGWYMFDLFFKLPKVCSRAILKEEKKEQKKVFKVYCWHKKKKAKLIYMKYRHIRYLQTAKKEDKINIENLLTLIGKSKNNKFFFRRKNLVKVSSVLFKEFLVFILKNTNIAVTSKFFDFLGKVNYFYLSVIDYHYLKQLYLMGKKNKVISLSTKKKKGKVVEDKEEKKLKRDTFLAFVTRFFFMVKQRQAFLLFRQLSELDFIVKRKYVLLFNKTLNNLFAFLFEMSQKRILFCCSLGQSGLKGPAKVSQTSSMHIGKLIALKCKKFKIKELAIVIRSPIDYYLRQFFKGFFFIAKQAKEVKKKVKDKRKNKKDVKSKFSIITQIHFMPKKAHNGGRKKNSRRK